MSYEIIEIESEDRRIAGYYATESDVPPEDWTWNDRGAGPELKHPDAEGPFATEAEAEAWIARQAIEQRPYRECLIEPHHAGFGMYQQGEPSGEGWADDDDLLGEIRTNLRTDIYELGVDDIEHTCLEDIRGRIHNERGRIFGWETKVGEARYFALVNLAS